MKPLLHIVITYNIDFGFVMEKIKTNNKTPVITLESAARELNIKTYRIAHELEEKGLKIVNTKHITKKRSPKENLTKIMLTNSLNDSE